MRVSVPLLRRNLLPFAVWDSDHLREETLMVPLGTLRSTSERQGRDMTSLHGKTRKHSSVPAPALLLPWNCIFPGVSFLTCKMGTKWMEK